MARDYILRLIEQIATMLAGLLARRKAGEVIEAREDLENLSVRTSGFTLSELKNLAPEEVSRLLKRTGSLQVIKSFTVAELFLLDAKWHEEDRTSEELLPNYVHAFCLIVDCIETLGKEDLQHYRGKLELIMEKLGELKTHPYIAERVARIQTQKA